MSTLNMANRKKTQWITNYLVAAAAIALTACGGGGGGGSGNSGNAGSTASSSLPDNSNFSVTIQPTEIKETLPLAGDSILLQATVAGDPGVKRIYANVVTTGEAIDQAQVVIDGNSGYLSIYPKRGLWNGLYQGDINITICADTNCNKHLAKSPYKIPYTFTVKNPYTRLEPKPNPHVKYFKNLPQEMVAYTQSGQASQTIQMRLDIPDSIVSYSFDPKIQQALSITNLQRNGFNLTLPAMPEGSGSYTWYPTIKTLNTSGVEEIIAFTIYQHVSPEGVDFNSFYFKKKSVTFNLPVGLDRRGGTGVPYYRPYAECRQSLQLLDLSIDYLSGNGWLTAADDYTAVGIGASQLGLEKGTYKAKVTAKTCDNLSQQVDVTLIVDSMFVLDNQFNGTLYASSQTADFGEYTISIFATEDAYPISWKVSAPDGGVKIDSDSATGSAITRNYYDGHYIKFKLPPEYIASLPNSASYNWRVLVEDPSGKLKPVTSEVRFVKMIPEITSVSNQVIEAGKSFDLVIKGNNLPENLATTPIAIVPKNNSAGVWGFLPITISLLETVDGGAKFRFSGITTPGDYELLVANEPEAKLNYSLAFVPRIGLKVIAPLPQTKTSYTLVPTP